MFSKTVLSFLLKVSLSLKDYKFFFSYLRDLFSALKLQTLLNIKTRIELLTLALFKRIIKRVHPLRAFILISRQIYKRVKRHKNIEHRTYTRLKLTELYPNTTC